LDVLTQNFFAQKGKHVEEKAHVEDVKVSFWAIQFVEVVVIIRMNISMPKIQEIDFWTETEFWVMQFVEAVALISAPNLKWKSQEMDFIVFFRTETETSSPKNL
jgi:hypothetical protein